MPNFTKLLFHYNMKVSVKANQNITCAVFLMIHLLSEYLIQHTYIMFSSVLVIIYTKLGSKQILS